MLSSTLEFFCLHRKHLLYALVLRNLKIKYRGSVLGFLWTMVIPFSQVAVYFFVYRIVFKVDIPNYMALIVSGILPWLFFASTVNESFDTLVSGQGLLNQVPMPIQIFPAASAYTHFINFLLSLPALGLVLAISGVRLGLQSLWFIPLTALLFVFAYSLAVIFSSLYVLFRDIKHIFSIVLQLWMYLTPILYTINQVPEKFRWIFYINPLSGYFLNLRLILLENQPPILRDLVSLVGWTLVMFLGANLVRFSLGPRLVERI